MAQDALGGGGGGASTAVPVLYGDGSDGTGTFDGTATPAGVTKSGVNYTATRDLYYTNATLSGGTTLNMVGFRLFCTGTLTVDPGCRVHNDGNAAVASTGGVAPSTGTIGGGSGNGAGSVSLGNDGANAPTVAVGLGGAGGNGGESGGSASFGGGGGTPTVPTAAQGYPRNLLAALIMRTPSGTTYNAGRGGASGGASATGSSGAGGGAGGLVLVVAKTIVHGGVFGAKGGNATAGQSGDSGGGGGGGGGAVVLVYGSKSGSGTFDVAGGSGGAGIGTGAAGNAGGAGNTYLLTA